jgi:hypothetical protein
MPKSLTASITGRGSRKAEALSHSLIGLNVLYLGKVWRVCCAHRASRDVEPWLTLRRGLTEVAAKPSEVESAFD